MSMATSNSRAISKTRRICPGRSVSQLDAAPTTAALEGSDDQLVGAGIVGQALLGMTQISSAIAQR
jgi:hypothetical protein